MLLKILLIRNDNIGDLVCTTPAIEAIRKKYPDSKIDIVVNSLNSFVVKNNPFLDRIYIYTKTKHKNKFLDKVIAFLKKGKILYEIKKEKYDIVHYHYGLDGFPVLLGAKLAGAKTIIVHGHNTLSPEKRSIPSRLYRFVARQIINLVADERIGCSKEANEFLFGDKPAKVINNPVDIEKFSLEKHPHVPSNKLRITNVGRYCFQKNQEFAIEVFAKVLNSHKDSVLNLVGFGEDKQQLKEKVMQMGLSNDVRFVDGNTSIPEILSQTDIFLFPSRYEGLGIVLIEAQSMGVYCIAADTIPESANVGLCEFVSLNATSDEWAEHVIRAFNDIENGIIDNSIVQVEDYSINNIKRKYVQIYSDKGN